MVVLRVRDRSYNHRSVHVSSEQKYVTRLALVDELVFTKGIVLPGVHSVSSAGAVDEADTMSDVLVDLSLPVHATFQIASLEEELLGESPVR